jgi:AraC-like DNA-binding protein
LAIADSNPSQGRGAFISGVPHSVARIATGYDFSIAASQLFGNVRLDFPNGQADCRRLVSVPLGDCRLSQLQAGIHTVHGDRVVARSFNPDALKLIIQSEGHSVLEQSGMRIAISDNAPVLYDPTRPYRLVNKTPVRLLMLQLPRVRFPQAMLQRLRAPLLSGRNGVASILLALMRSTMAEVDGAGAATRASVGAAMTELVRALAEGEAMPEQATRPSLDLLLERIKDFIEHNFSRPELSVALIARRMGCSPRYVFRAFEQDGTTPADYLWGLRLQKAREHLQTAEEKARSISDIAFSLGFSSTAHFSRAFRERYDMSPRDCRRRS